VAIRALTVVAISLFLIDASLSVVPAAVFAAPPDPGAEQETSDSTSGKESPDSSENEDGLLKRLPDELIDKEQAASGELAARGWPVFESIRRRGLEAPVELRQPAPAPVEEESDKGDGEPRQERSSSESRSKPDSEKDEAKKQSPRSQDKDIRVWPMRADSYSFTQAFGCVPQIANFYFPGENCPASAPVIHSGVDLAAPEGTPFYAAASGWVTSSGYDREVGVPNTRIIIQHDGRNDGFATEYLHWIASFVEVGDYVEAGEQIGEVGSVGYSTGPHLHFSVVELQSGEHVDPVRWLPDEPGSQGYRGIRPNSRARMRLPAGTTAGLPESADPAPPPPPEREEVPESPPPSDADNDVNGKDRSAGKRKRHREERRAEKRNASAEDQSEGAVDESVDASETDTDDTVKEGKDKERTRKRERKKDGQQEERASKGEDGGKRKSDDKGNNDSGDRKKNGGRHGNGNGNGNGNGRNNDNSDNGKDKQDKSNDRDRNDRNKSEDNSGADGSDSTDGSSGNDGANPDGDESDSGSDGAEDDASKDDGGGADGDATGDDLPDENNAGDSGGDKGNSDVKGDGEATAAQSADDTATQPDKKANRRESA
jgi:murein DD-endopeptidase MepM/ murein hydrolase activator NlpD